MRMTKPRSLVVMTFRKGVRAVQLVGKASEFRIFNVASSISFDQNIRHYVLFVSKIVKSLQCFHLRMNVSI